MKSVRSRPLQAANTTRVEFREGHGDHDVVAHIPQIRSHSGHVFGVLAA